MYGNLSHFDETGASRMVDVGEKPTTSRSAKAEVIVIMQPETLVRAFAGDSAKGNPLEVSRIAGIMAAKRTAELIPLCHPISISHVAIDFEKLSESELAVRSFVKTDSRTGVEMEALVACSVASLTLYDMLKSLEKSIRMDQLRLIEKTGGKSGDYHASL